MEGSFFLQGFLDDQDNLLLPFSSLYSFSFIRGSTLVSAEASREMDQVIIEHLLRDIKEAQGPSLPSLKSPIAWFACNVWGAEVAEVTWSVPGPIQLRQWD